MNDFPARIVNGRAQSIDQHLNNVASYSIENLKQVDMESLCKIIALYHDCGKYTDEFKEYITKVTSQDLNIKSQAIRGSVNHTFAGVQLIFKNHYDNSSSDYKKLTAEIIAFVSGSHHGQFDCLDKQGVNGFSHRLNTNIPIDIVSERFYKNTISKDELDILFKKAVKEISNIVIIINTMVSGIKSNQEVNQTIYFYVSFIARILLASLVDADRKDAMEFYYNIKAEDFIIKAIWEEELNHIEEKLKLLKPKNHIDTIRNNISDEATKFKDRECGIYKLSIPTGSGKTLVSLRASILHAKKHNKNRIIFVIPLLSILEQNASVIKEYISNASIITEHHSNIVQDNIVQDNIVQEKYKASSQENTLNINEFLAETWDSPIIITTLFQFLNTLFDGKNTSIRRMKSLVNSVIVIDEIQQIPKNMISIFNLAINFLSKVCGATIIFSSATQPDFESAKRPILFNKNPELVDFNPEIEKHFYRTQIIPIYNNKNNNKLKKMDLKQVESFIIDILDGNLEKYHEVTDDLNKNLNKNLNSILIICNKKEQASFLHKELSSYKKNVFHLSASMCMQHRENVIKEINQNLENQNNIICISTQLVEAGIDFSFSCVIRFLAGIDNIIQSAGRCNRHGEYDKLCPVYVINVKENLNNLTEIKEAKRIMSALLLDKNIVINSSETIKRYYKNLFKNQSKSQDYTIEISNIFNLLSWNQENISSENKYLLRQSFKYVGDNFKVFENNTIDIIVSYQESKVLIAELLSDNTKYNLSQQRKIISKLKKYSVSIYENEFKSLMQKGAIQSIFYDSVYILSQDFYNNKRGIEEDFLFIEI